MTSHNGHELKPLESRKNAHQLEARAFKRQDRATFRQRVERTFTEVGRGMGIFDAAIATTYGRFTRFVYIQMVMWVILIAYLVWERMR